MLTLGVDLAAQPSRSCACAVDWARTRPLVRVIDWEKANWKLSDARLVELVTDASFAVVGVDVPFGWPVAFEALLAGTLATSSYESASKKLRLRATDRFCAATVAGVKPLSVSADMLAAPAMRWRMLRDRVAAAASRTREVYPAGALAAWGLPHTGYKGRSEAAARRTICSGLVSALSLEIDSQNAEWIESEHDALDALVAAVVARAFFNRRTYDCPPEMRTEAATEGWIELPNGTLAELASSAEPAVAR